MSTAPNFLKPGTALKRIAAALAAVIVMLTLLTTPRFTPPAEAQPAQTSPTGVCGGNIALVFDLSRHMNSGLLGETKSAANTFVDSMTGTGTSLGVYNFASAAPASGTSLHAQPVETHQQQITDAINNMTFPNGNAHQNSSWEDGLQSVLDSQVVYDTVFFFTAGPPTANVTTNGMENNTNFVDIDRAVAAKDELHAQGTEVVPVGMGKAVVNDSVNVEGTNKTVASIVEQLETPQASTLMAVGTDAPLIPEQMKQFGLPACLTVTQNLVDVNDEVVGAGADWDFTVDVFTADGAPEPLTTNAEGTASTKLRQLHGSTTADLRITGVNREFFEPVTATCEVGGASFDGSPASPDGALEVEVHDVEPGQTIDCTFNSREVVPVTLSKTITATPQALLEQVREREFDFEYACYASRGDAGSLLLQGSLEAVADGDAIELTAAAPVGAECQIIENIPATDETLQFLQTTWSLSGASAMENSGEQPEQELWFKVAAPSVPGAGAVNVGARNAYFAETGSVTITVETSGVANPPSTFPVRYFCRYIPDPDARPELGGDEQNPADVMSGYVFVNGGGEAVIEGLPVGTQCGFEQIDENGEGPAVTGFAMRTTWSSNACLDYLQPDSEECVANYIRIPSEGNFDLTISNDYRRENSSLQINVAELTGDAAARGQQQQFLFDVTCRDTDGTEIFATDGAVGAAQDVPALLTGLPVGSDCEVVESGTLMSGVNISHDPVQVTIPGAGETAVADVRLRLEPQTSSLTVNVKYDMDGVAGTDASFLQEAEITVNAQCRAPGSEESYPVSASAPDNGAVEMDLPVGTFCQFNATATGLNEPDRVPGVMGVAEFSPVALTVTEESATVSLTMKFRSSAKDQVVIQHMEVMTDPGLQPLLAKTSYSYADLGCLATPLSWSPQEGSQSMVIDDVSNFPCEITVTIGDPSDQAVTRETTWTLLADDRDPLTGSSTASTVTIPLGADLADSTGVKLIVEHTYSLVRSRVEVAAVHELNEVPENAFADNIRAAVLGNQRHLVTYTCRVGEDTVDAGSLVLAPGGAAEPLQTPVGAECAFVAGQETVASTTGPDTTWTGAAQGEDSTTAVLTVPVGTSAVTVNHSYELKLGGLNLKNKVDGEGVATIHSEDRYALTYVCTLDDVVVAQVSEPPLRIGRFDNGEDFPVRDVPVGAECAFLQDRAEAEVTMEEDGEDVIIADLSTRWTVAGDTTGWGASEVACALWTGCRQDGDNPFQATLQILDPVADGNEPAIEEDPYFQGTLVFWNTYEYHKTQLAVDNQLAGDGAELAADDLFVYQYRCTDARYEGSDLGDLPYVPDPTVTGTLLVQGDGTAVEVITDPADPEGWVERDDAQLISIGFDCEITQQPVPTYDAELTTEFSTGAPGPEEPASTTFTTRSEFRDTVQQVSVVNAYERARADLAIKADVDTGVPGDVSAYLNAEAEPQVQVVCEDPYLEQRAFDGTVTAPDTIENLPVSVNCEITGGADDAYIPEGFENVVQARTSWSVAPTRPGQPSEGTSNGAAVVQISGLTLEETTKVSFQSEYIVPRQPLALASHVENGGEEAQQAGWFSFHYTYECRMPLLPGQPEPPAMVWDADGNERTGDMPDRTFTLGAGEVWAIQDAPVGSECDVALDDEEGKAGVGRSPGAEAFLKRSNLDYQLNFGFLAGAEELTDIVREPLDPAKTVALDNTAGNHNAHVFLTLHRVDDKIVVQAQKVNPGGEVLEARFAIYQADAATNGPGEPVIENMIPTDRVILPVGTYFLVETTAAPGTQLLPQPWQFGVLPPETSEDGTELLDVRLAAFTESGGLIEVTEPDVVQDPWIIQVANISAGELPLTGGRGVWPGLLVGTGVLLAAGAWFLLGRRRD